MNGYLFLFLFLFATAVGASIPNGYSVTESGNLVFLKTPWGSTVYIGPVGLENFKNYSFEVPLSEFRSALAASNAPNSGSGSVVSSGASTVDPAAYKFSDTSSLIVEANRLYNGGESAKSLQYVDEVIRRDPNHVRGWVMKGSLMHLMGHKDLARQSWEKALELDPKNTQIENILRSTQ